MSTTKDRFDNLTAKVMNVITSFSIGGVQVTATPTELNGLAGLVAGVVTASMAIVAGATKNLDTLMVNLFGFGSGGVETGLTAHAGGTQAAALALSAAKSVHNVTIVGSAADSVKLPAATGSGIVHLVRNSAAVNALQLFGAATETIDGVASATGVPIMAGKSRFLVDFAAGTWLSLYGVDGVTATAAFLNLNDGAIAGQVVASKSAIYDSAGKVRRSSLTPAAAGATVADATPLTAEFNTVTGADGSTGVLLPIAAADEVVVVVNTNAANPLKVYAITGSQINALGSTVAFVVPPGQTAVFVGRSATLWYTAAPLTAQGVTAGLKVNCSTTPLALDGSNPTSFAHGLTTCYAAIAILAGSVAPGASTIVLTTVINGANIDVYGWKPTTGGAAGNPTLIASTGTETFHWFVIGI